MKRETVYLDIQDIWPIALVFVVTAIGVAFGADIMDSFRTDVVNAQAVTSTCNSTSGVYTGCGYAYNSTTSSLSATDNLTKKIPTIALVVVAAILIGVLIRNLAMKG
jgi:hypothetical protein